MDRRRKVKVEAPGVPGEVSVAQALKLAASIAALGAALGVNAPSALASHGSARNRTGEVSSAPKDSGAPASTVTRRAKRHAEPRHAKAGRARSRGR